MKYLVIALTLAVSPAIAQICYTSPPLAPAGMKAVCVCSNMYNCWYILVKE